MTKTADRFMWGADFCIIKTDRALICIYMMNSYKLIQKKGMRSSITSTRDALTWCQEHNRHSG